MYPNRTLEIIFDDALRRKLIDAVVAPSGSLLRTPRVARHPFFEALSCQSVSSLRSDQFLYYPI